MKLSRPDLAAYALCALCIVGILVCAVLKVPAPDFLTFAGTTALGAGAGAALQGATSSSSSSSPSSSSTPAAAAAPVIPPQGIVAQGIPPQGIVAPAPAWATTTDPAATGVMRATKTAP